MNYCTKYTGKLALKREHERMDCGYYVGSEDEETFEARNKDNWYYTDYMTVDIVAAFIFTIIIGSDLQVPDVIYRTIINFYVIGCKMAAAAKWYRVYDNMRTARSLKGIPRDWREHFIRCDKWVKACHDEWIHSWRFFINDIPMDRDDVHFRIFIKGSENDKTLTWWPRNSKLHRIKNFSTHDIIIISIIFKKEKATAILEVNDWLDGPVYHLDQYIAEDMNCSFTVGWITCCKDVEITLTNYREWYDKKTINFFMSKEGR